MSTYTRNGYRVVYDPTYVGRSGRRYKDGCVYEHILVMERHLGRRLRGDEVVHHKDGNRANNDIANLELTTRKEHSTRHAIESGFDVNRKCSDCGKPMGKSKTGLCWSCWNKRRRKVVRPTKEACLAIVADYTNTEIGSKMGVNEATVRKWFKEYGIADLVSRIRLWSKKCKNSIS